MLATRLALLTAARRVSPRLASARCAHGHAPSQHEIEKIPPHFRNITYDDIPFPKGSWQARYDELNKKYNMLLAGAVAFASFTIYVLCQTHEWIGVPDEPAERWYPVDRFAPGEDGKSVI